MIGILSNSFSPRKTPFYHDITIVTPLLYMSLKRGSFGFVFSWDYYCT